MFFDARVVKYTKVVMSNPKSFNSDLKPALYPYLIFLRCLGIVHWPTGYGIKVWKDPWILYSFLIMLYSWVGFFIRLQISPLSKATTVEFFMFFMSMAGVLKELMGITALFILMISGNGLQAIFALWTKMRFTPDRQKILRSRLRMASWGILGTFLILSIFQLAVYVSAICLSPYNLFDASQHFEKVRLLLRFGCIFINIHIIGFIVLICAALFLLFCEVNLALVGSLRKHVTDQDPLENLKQFSNLFRLATKTVSKCDRLLSFVIGPCLMSYICQMVFNTYFLIKGESDNYRKTFPRYWIAESFVAVFVILASTALVNIQAHKSYEVLCNAKTENMAMPLQLIIIRLQNRLTNSSIGLSAFGIQVLTIRFIPSVISVYLTYIFLVIQFNTGTAI